MSRPALRRRRAIRLACLTPVVICVTSCGGPDPGPVAADLARGLERLDVAGVPLEGSSTDEVNSRLADATAGMDDVRPAVELGPVSEADGAATATLHVSWPLADGVVWTYDTRARLVESDGEWTVVWKPTILAPGLDDDHRLVTHTNAPERGDILGAGDKPIVTERPVVRVGIDRTRVAAAKAAASARSLARLVGVDADDFVKRVTDAGRKAFVEAIVLRTADAPPTTKIEGITGARALEDSLPLAPTRSFAAPILGRVGPATAELIENSDGRLATGDVTGLSGLEQRYDERLFGRKGVSVESVSTIDDDKSETLFEHRPTPGKPLHTTLDARTQRAAERALSAVGQASALVAIRPSDGDVLAAASGAGGNGYSTATVGRYAPGSTFKIVSSLAMLRNGFSLGDSVPCSRTTTVNGKQFKNYDGYPVDRLGRISLLSAIANSCNTAVISTRGRVSQSDLADAAASLGLGVDHDLGFPVFLGAVPRGAEATEHAASMIGQGKVQASPLAMATVAASVKAGRTVVPRLIADHQAPKASAEMGDNEGPPLRRLMRAVVTQGSGSVLRGLPGPPVGAKTGTAEYGTATPAKTHAWMIATQGDLAVAAFVADGKSGSGTAGPIVERFLRAVR